MSEIAIFHGTAAAYKLLNERQYSHLVLLKTHLSTDSEHSDAYECNSTTRSIKPYQKVTTLNSNCIATIHSLPDVKSCNHLYTPSNQYQTLHSAIQEKSAFACLHHPMTPGISMTPSPTTAPFQLTLNPKLKRKSCSVHDAMHTCPALNSAKALCCSLMRIQQACHPHQSIHSLCISLIQLSTAYHQQASAHSIESALTSCSDARHDD